MTTYCTQSDIERLLSAAGALSFADHDENGTAETGVFGDCIDQASGEIELFTNGWYDATGLASSTLVTRWATVMASVFLCQRRGNPVPESLQMEFERISAMLERVRTGELRIPGVAFSADMRPAFSNLTIDRRFNNQRARVVRQSSSGGAIRQNTAEDAQQ